LVPAFVRAVECLYPQVDMTAPPYPFVQRWDQAANASIRVPILIVFLLILISFVDLNTLLSLPLLVGALELTDANASIRELKGPNKKRKRKQRVQVYEGYEDQEEYSFSFASIMAFIVRSSFASPMTFVMGTGFAFVITLVIGGLRRI
jgi:hypothetical protein